MMKRETKPLHSRRKPRGLGYFAMPALKALQAHDGNVEEAISSGLSHIGSDDDREYWARAVRFEAEKE